MATDLSKMTTCLFNTYDVLSKIPGVKGNNVSQDLLAALEVFREIIQPSRNTDKNAANKPQTLEA